MSACISATGHLGKDAEHKTVGDTEVAEFTVAVRHYKGRDKEATTSWFRVTVWGKAAAAITDWRKGDMVTVSGELEIREYEKDGVKRLSPEIRATMFTNFDRIKRGKAGGGESAPAPRPAPRPAPSKEAMDDLPF